MYNIFTLFSKLNEKDLNYNEKAKSNLKNITKIDCPPEIESGQVSQDSSSFSAEKEGEASIWNQNLIRYLEIELGELIESSSSNCSSPRELAAAACENSQKKQSKVHSRRHL